MTLDSPVLPGAACPLCHTASARLADAAFAAGGYWRCTTCGQSWTAQRLATVAAYTAWVASRTSTTAAVLS
jgi:ribosomal protein L37AE/L43A